MKSNGVGSSGVTSSLINPETTEKQSVPMSEVPKSGLEKYTNANGDAKTSTQMCQVQQSAIEAYAKSMKAERSLQEKMTSLQYHESKTVSADAAQAYGDMLKYESADRAGEMLTETYTKAPKKFAHVLRHLADRDPEAYKIAMEGTRQLNRFEDKVLLKDSKNDFYKEVATLHGPGAEKVKMDVLPILYRNMDKASKTNLGDPDVFEYSKRVGEITGRNGKEVYDAFKFANSIEMRAMGEFKTRVNGQKLLLAVLHQP